MIMKDNFTNSLIILGLLMTTVFKVSGQQEAADPSQLAKELANPVASLISVPFQNNTDYGIGPNNGSKNTLNFQPVIPVVLTPELNMIVRVILPVIAQRNVTGPGTSQDGLSDMTPTFFFTPSAVINGLILAAGPVFLVPTATDKNLGTQKFGIGPSGLILKQSGLLTYGLLFNQIWSVAGSADRAAVNQLYMQPFFSRNWKSGAGLGINAELTENWQAGTFTGYLNPIVNGVTKLGKQVVQLAVGPRIPIAGPSGFRPDFGIRAVFTLVFPK
jgi:hypothetical protein